MPDTLLEYVAGNLVNHNTEQHMIKLISAAGSVDTSYLLINTRLGYITKELCQSGPTGSETCIILNPITTSLPQLIVYVDDTRLFMSF